MLMQEYSQTMHFYFNSLLKMRQYLRKQVQSKLAEFGHADVTLEMTQILYYIHFIAKNQQTNQKDIAERTGKNKSSVTSLINNLEKRNLIKREINPESRRSNIISLTSEGLQFVEDIYDNVYKTFDLEAAEVSLLDLQKSTELMDKLMHHKK